MTNKSQLRIILKQRILQIQDRDTKDRLIEQNLHKNFPNLKNKNILAFNSLEDEPNLDRYFQQLQLQNNVFFANYKELNMFDKYQNISEDFSMIEIAFIPGLGFTSDGYRLGRGGGWYDRAISQMSGDVVATGICYEDQIIGTLNIEPHDKKVDRVITEKF